jgi:molybdate transport system ATP-binding protein
MASGSWVSGIIVLTLDNIVSQAGAFKLEPVTLHVEEGDCHVILGPTGSGKTVLLETILGLRDVISGHISLAGREVTSIPVEKRSIGYVPQDLALFPHLNVLENIRYGSNVREGEGHVDDSLINELTSAVRIEHLLQRFPENLSGGERQRVALVRAIASGCKVLLLDEPFSSVNESLRKDLWLMMKQLQARFGLTLLMITHDLEEAFFLGDRLSVMINGRIHQSDNKRNAYQQPATHEVAQFYGIKNLFDGVLSKNADGSATVKTSTLHYDLAVDMDQSSIAELENTEVITGIRAVEVMILREEADPSRWENTMTGHVHVILDKGAAYTVLFNPDNAPDLHIEIELNSHAYRRLRLNEGKKVSISLKKENLFVIQKH